MGIDFRRRLLAAAGVGLCLFTAAAAADELQRALEACADIERDDDRLSCYDTLASAHDGPGAGDDGEAPAPDLPDSERDRTAQSPPIITLDRDEGREKDVFNVRLTRCTEASVSGRQVYYLDNGEVWRQSNASSNKVRNCDAPVTIQKDLFGYKMHVPSEDRNIRIRPVRQASAAKP